MEAIDGKLRETDIADNETLFRIILSIPQKTAGTGDKQWQAKTGYERMKEFDDPEQSPDITKENRKEKR